MKPIAAAGIGALISGLAFYAVGTRAAQTNGWVELPAVVQTVDGRFVRVPGAESMAYPQQMAYVSGDARTAGLQPAAAPVLVRESPAPTRTVYRTATPAQERVVERPAEPTRSVAKTVLIIGGSTASGAGVGGLIGGRKGALVGAAIGGGAASIYEATRRR